MDTLQERIEEFAITGTTTFKRWELRSWFNAERIGKNIWRALQDHIAARKPKAEVKIIEINDGFLLMDATLIEDIKVKI